MDELNNILSLPRKQIVGTLTDEDRYALAEWSKQHPAYADLLKELSDEDLLFAGYADYLEVYEAAVSQRLERISGHLMDVVGRTDRTLKVRWINRWLPYAAAAVVLVALMTALWMSGNREPWSNAGQDIAPGGNRATLTLADGKQIDLSEAHSDIVVGNGITYLDGSSIWLEGIPETLDDSAVGSDGGARQPIQEPFMAIATPKGGTYSIRLPDGTTVTLNAASSLRYPYRFAGDERTVELIGEAYFAVAKDVERPFTILSNGKRIQVLGTEFNVSDYPDDDVSRITLVSGSIRVEVNSDPASQVVMKPGEQATIQGKDIAVRQVDTELYTAWKEGYFYFEKTHLKDLLRQAARWYDITIEYPDRVPDETLSGEISRHVSLRGFFEIMKLSTIDVELRDRTLIVK